MQEFGERLALYMFGTDHLYRDDSWIFQGEKKHSKTQKYLRRSGAVTVF